MRSEVNTHPLDEKECARLWSLVCDILAAHKKRTEEERELAFPKGNYRLTYTTDQGNASLSPYPYAHPGGHLDIRLDKLRVKANVCFTLYTQQHIKNFTLMQRVEETEEKRFLRKAKTLVTYTDIPRYLLDGYWWAYLREQMEVLATWRHDLTEERLWELRAEKERQTETDGQVMCRTKLDAAFQVDLFKDEAEASLFE